MCNVVSYLYVRYHRASFHDVRSYVPTSVYQPAGTSKVPVPTIFTFLLQVQSTLNLLYNEYRLEKRRKEGKEKKRDICLKPHYISVVQYYKYYTVTIIFYFQNGGGCSLEIVPSFFSKIISRVIHEQASDSTIINFIISTWIMTKPHQQNEMNIEVTYRSEMKPKEPANKPLRVLFLSSDTGGGHRASGMFNTEHGALCFFT